MKTNIRQINKDAGLWTVGGFLLLLLPYLYWQSAYLIVDFVFVLGLLLLPFITTIPGGRPRIIFAVLSVLLFLLAYWCQLSTLGYFGAGFALLYWTELNVGRLNNLPLLLLLVLSPIFKTLSYAWSFPIRLWLSERAAQALAMLGRAAHAEGNIIWIDGYQMAVDPACMGLKLLGTGLLLTLMVLAQQERRSGRPISFAALSLLSGLALLLAVIANFTRLLALVLFKILPGTLMHDFIGLAALVLYVLMPLYVGTSWYYSRKPTAKPPATSTSVVPPLNKILVLGILSIALALSAQHLNNRKVAPDLKLETATVSGFKKTITEFGVAQFENDQLLVYIKPPVNPFKGSHDPRICWRGSGYTFTAVQKAVIDGYPMYTATLVNGTDQLYAAWWYDDGSIKTNEEWTWRKAALQGSNFYLVNVNAADQATLQKGVLQWLQHPW